MNFNSIASIQRILSKWTGKSIAGGLKFELLILCPGPSSDSDSGAGRRWMISYCRQDLLPHWTWESLTEPSLSLTSNKLFRQRTFSEFSFFIPATVSVVLRRSFYSLRTNCLQYCKLELTFSLKWWSPVSTSLSLWLVRQI